MWVYVVVMSVVLTLVYMVKWPNCLFSSKRNVYIKFLYCFIFLSWKETIKISEKIYFDWCSITHRNKPDWLGGNFFVL